MSAPVPVQSSWTRHEGDGVTTSFLIGFDLPLGTPLLIMVAGLPVELGEDYSIVGDQIVFAAAPADGTAIGIERRTVIGQSKAFTAQPTIVPQSIENALNERARVDQDLAARLDRAIVVPIGETAPTPEQIILAVAAGPVAAEALSLAGGLAGDVIYLEALADNAAFDAAAALTGLAGKASQADLEETDAKAVQAAEDAAYAEALADNAAFDAAAAAAAVDGKLDKAAGGTVSAPVAVETAPATQALAAGSEFGSVAIQGSEEVGDFVLDSRLFQDVPRQSLKVEAKGLPGTTLDLELVPKGILGQVRTNRIIISAKTGAQTNGMVGLHVMTNAPEEEETLNAIDLGYSVGPPSAPIYGITGGVGIGHYPDIDQAAISFRGYATRNPIVATTGYTQAPNVGGVWGPGTVTLAEPLPEDHDLELSCTLQTAASPWHRGVLTGISEDRTVLTVYGWGRDMTGTDPNDPANYFFEAPSGNPGIYLNIFTKGFGTNGVSELHGPIYKRVKDHLGTGTDKRFAWFTSGGTFIPYADGQSADATKPTAANYAAGDRMGEHKPAHRQGIMFIGELNTVNTKGPCDYAGTSTITVDNGLGGTEVVSNPGIWGCKNLVSGLEVVMAPSFYTDPETGQPVRTYSGFGFKTRGQYLVGFETQESVNYGFRVLRGFTNPSVAGFAYEAGHKYNQDTAFLVSPGQDPHWRVTARGNMEIGSKTINHGGNTINFFTAGDGASDASLTVSGGDASGFSRGTLQWLAGAHVFLGEDGTAQFRVASTPGTSDYLSVTGSNSLGPYLSAVSSNANANINIVPKGSGAVLIPGAASSIPLVVTEGSNNLLTLGADSVVFGPFSAQWFSYTLSSGLVRLGAPGSAIFSGTTANAAINPAVTLARSGAGAYSLLVTPVASAVNQIEIRGNTAGSGPRITALGSDANIDLVLVPKGTGILNLDYVGAGASASVGANFVAERMIPIKTPFGTFYVPAKISPW